MIIKKIGLLVAALAFGVALNAQTPEKKECCAKSKAAACTSTGSKDSKATAATSANKTTSTQKTAETTTTGQSDKK